jgi:transcriptional regulator with XRE-family HTH domain
MDENLPQAFSEALKKIRKQKNLSQMELAARAKLHLNAVGALERGTRSPNLQTVHSLAKALGISMVELIRDAESTLSGIRHNNS